MKWPLTPPLGAEPAPWRSPRAARQGDEDAFEGSSHEPRKLGPLEAVPGPWVNLQAVRTGLQGPLNGPLAPSQGSMDLSEIEPAPLDLKPKSVRASPAKPKRDAGASSSQNDEVSLPASCCACPEHLRDPQK